MTTYLFEIRATDKGMKVEYPTNFDNYPATNFTGLVALCAAVLTSSFLKEISAYIENDPKEFLDAALSIMKRVNEEFKTDGEVPF
jgi:hypothetical protein